jgi:hypothetical protein
MTKLELEIFDDVVSTLNKIRNINDAGIELMIPEGSILFENVLNLKLIKKHADRFNQTVHFLTNDIHGAALIGMVEEGATPDLILEREGNVTTLMPQMSSGKKLNMEFITTPFSNVVAYFRNMVAGSKKSFVMPVVIALLLVLGFHFMQTNREASVKLIINSQPLTKSVTVKVKANSSSNGQNKILAGINLQNTLELTKETDTTGEKIVGEKAKGKAKIFNKTDSDKEFDKGQVLIFEDDDKELNFVLDDDVTVPARTEDLVTHVITPGVAEVDVVASLVGTEYNIDEDEPLEVYKQKKADFSAVSSVEFTGGKSEKKKIVAQADITKLQTELATEINNQADTALKSKIANSQSLVAGSFKVTPVKEEPNHKVGDEEDKVSVTKTVTVEGLVYQNSELDRLLDELLKEFVPEGFVLSSKDREISVHVLGNATNSVLNSTEADIQVTIKSFIVPNISEDDIKKQLAGKSTAEAQKILGSVRNIETYEFNLAKGFIPVFNKVPNDTEKITVEIVKK